MRANPRRSNEVRVRWFQRTDFPQAYRLVAGTGTVSHETLAACLESPDTVGLVAERKGQLVGLLVYRLIRDLNEVAILGIWIGPEWRRQGIGSTLLRRVRQKSAQNYHLVSVAVPEDRLEAQLFLRSQGFRAATFAPEAGSSPPLVMELGLPARTRPAD
jgi:ribosomal protein S18 acetylase RimI-like enzyme